MEAYDLVYNGQEFPSFLPHSSSFIMDWSAIAALVALIIASLALLTALAQAAQQYLATGQVMRKCDQSVWGPMPGRSGRRIWNWHQFRFKVVFDMPNLFIPTEYWDVHGVARVYPARRVIPMKTPFETLQTNLDPENAVRQSSEACWVSFTRQVSAVCPEAIRFGLKLGDADRYPTDLAVVPMQVSMRDIIALGLMVGMKIKDASYFSNYLEMNGPFGCIRSSDHPLLGTLIHFTAFSQTPGQKGLSSGDLSRSWLARVRGTASVAQRPYGPEQRSYYEHLATNWRTAERRGLHLFETDTVADNTIKLVILDMMSKRH